MHVAEAVEVAIVQPPQDLHMAHMDAVLVAACTPLDMQHTLELPECMAELVGRHTDAGRNTLPVKGDTGVHSVDIDFWAVEVEEHAQVLDTCSEDTSGDKFVYALVAVKVVDEILQACVDAPHQALVSVLFVAAHSWDQDYSSHSSCFFDAPSSGAPLHRH